MSDDEPMPLPRAKIEDGKSFPPQLESKPRVEPRQASVRGLGLVIGTIALLFAIVCGLLVCAGRGLGSMTSGLGRPLRRRGRPRLARYRRGDALHDTAVPDVAGLGVWCRARRGAAWLHAARAEQASVPAFEQLAMQLASLGAPPSLVARCHDAARDEARHARRCYALASAYHGIAWTAGDAPEPSSAPVDITALAIESLIDGCLGEDIAAELARRSAQQATDPTLRAAFAMFAEDEARHAELAWNIVAFCCERDASLRPRLSLSLDERVRVHGPYELTRAEMRAVARERHTVVRRRLGGIELGAAVSQRGPKRPSQAKTQLRSP